MAGGWRFVVLSVLPLLLSCPTRPSDDPRRHAARRTPTSPTPADEPLDAAADLDRQLATRSADAELAQIADRLRRAEITQDEADPDLSFHAVAHADRIFRMACDSSSPVTRDLLVRALGAGSPAGHGWFERIPTDDAIPCLDRLARESAVATEKVSRIPDARLASTHAWIERERPSFAASARAARALAGVHTDDAVVARIRSAEDDVTAYTELVHLYWAFTRDPRPMMPALVAALQRPDLPIRVRAVTMYMLGLVAPQLRPTGDAAARFWELNRSHTVDEWLVNATRDDQRTVRKTAYTMLGMREPTELGRAALLRGLAESDGELRAVAAYGLAAWRDPQAAPTLADLLPDPSAYLSLAWLHDTTLGFRWDDPEASQTRAIARWREWARRAGRTGADGGR